MRSSTALLLAVVVAGCTSGAGAAPAASTVPAGSTAPAATAALTGIGAGLQGPAGLAASVYATGLANVSAFAFDGGGRLWAATAGFDDTGSDAVYLVASPGATPTRIIAGLHTPLGLVWDADVLYVASEGRVEAYADLDDGAFATRTTVMTLPDGVGEVNGLVESPDGRLVLGISAPCDACTPASEYAAAVVSFLPDGSDLRIEASDIRAPVGLAYYPGTDDLFVTMNQRDDLEAATPGDWLALVRSGQSWGFPDCFGQDATACDGVPEPVAELDAHAAVSGVAIVERLGSWIGSSAFVAEWSKGVVLRVALAAEGEVYSGTVQPFLSGLTNPVPVAAAPDGAILVGDWGTGTIYRVAPA
jgi:glucose/arabinose dehydrogenase